MSSRPIPDVATQAPDNKLVPAPDPAEVRQKPDLTASDTPRDDANLDLELLQGTWRSITMVIDGRTIPAAALEHRRIIVIDDKYVVVDGDLTLRRGSIRIDPTTTPKQIDALPMDGHHAGKIDQGIFELTPGLLRLCWSPPGRPRPTDFTSEPGSGQWMATDQKDLPTMAAERSAVIAVPGESAGCPGVSATRVHHRDFPELHGEGQTPYEAGLNLLHHLISEQGTIADGWRRAGLEQVIADIRSFLDRVA
jgi:uncharacterized protein (TIGR03067 family)